MGCWAEFKQVKNYIFANTYLGFPGGAGGREPVFQCRSYKVCGFDPWVGKIPWKRAWQCTPVFLPGESHGQRTLEGSGPWGCKDSDMTEVTEHTLGKEIVITRQTAGSQKASSMEDDSEHDWMQQR